MRYNELPAEARAKLAPKIMAKIRGRIEDTDQNGHIKMDGIWFENAALAGRYGYLLAAADRGCIMELHIRENITLRDSVVLPGGEKLPQIRCQADFSYIPTGKAYTAGIKAGDSYFWEELSETCPGGRVFELMHRISPQAARMARQRGILLREVAG